jgi:hypothetical protein
MVDKIEAKLNKLKENNPTMSNDLKFKIVQLNIKLMNSKNKNKDIHFHFDKDDNRKMDLINLNDKILKLEESKSKIEKSNVLLNKDLEYLEMLNKKLMTQNSLFVEKFQKLKDQCLNTDNLEVNGLKII